VTGHLDRASLSADITGRTERYACQAEPDIRVATTQLGGFLVIITHATDPEQLTPDMLMPTFASLVTLVGWTQP
jgi:hypothetical protein